MSSAANFSDKVVIITGSSSGIGQAAAILFAKAGASVTIHGRSEEGLKKTLDFLKAAGIPEDKICVVKGDIIEETTLKALIENTVAKFGKIDVLINNAGLGGKTGIASRSMENFDNVLAVNLKAPIALTELAIPYLEKTKGNIINISSILSTKTTSNMPFYGISKAALDHFARNYAAILAPKNIRVNNLNPGFTESDFVNRVGMPESAVSKFKAAVTATVPLGRDGTPEEMGEFLLFMASDQAAYMTGDCLKIDGGMLIRSQIIKMD